METVKFLKQMLIRYVNEHLKVLEKLKKESLDKKTVYNFDNITGACQEILNNKRISHSIKTKLCGNIIAQGLTKNLWKLCQKESINYKLKEHDIKNLAILIQNNAKGIGIKHSFRENFTRFARADRVRNQSSHAYERYTAPH